MVYQVVTMLLLPVRASPPVHGGLPSLSTRHPWPLRATQGAKMLWAKHTPLPSHGTGVGELLLFQRGRERPRER